MNRISCRGGAVKDNTLYESIQQDAYADLSDGAGPTGKVKSVVQSFRLK